MKKFFAILASAFTFCTLSPAETFQVDEKLTIFNAIEACNTFQVNIKYGSDYSVHLDVDKRVENFYTVFLNGGTLVLGINEKEYAKDLVKNIFNQRDTSPLVLIATVYIPQNAEINNILLEDSAVLTSDVPFTASNDFSIETTETSAVRGIDVTAGSLSVKADKKSTVIVSSCSGDNYVVTKNSSNVDLTLTGNNLDMTCESFSQLTVSGTLNQIRVNASGSSKQTIKTTADMLYVVSKGNAYTDAYEGSIVNTEVDLVSAKCRVRPIRSLVISAASNASLEFGGTPEIIIRKINSSTVLPVPETETDITE